MKSKLNNFFQTLVLLMAMLILGTPFCIFAQHNAVMLDAKADAEKDAERDVKKLEWFVAGIGACGIGIVAGIGGLYVGSKNDNSPVGDFFSEAEETGFSVGLVVGASIPFIGIYLAKPNLPPERFIGKSPDYIDYYTDAYRKKAQSIRINAAVSGCLLAPILFGGCFGAAIALGGS